MFMSSLHQQKENQKLSELLSKVCEKSIYFNEYKTKSENKNDQGTYMFSQIKFYCSQ